MLDSETRFWLAKMVAEHKGNDDVAPMFNKAKQMAGKVPETLVSDGASNFSHAHKKQYAAKNFLHKDSERIRHIHMSGDMNNNQMESFNGNAVRLWENVTRGLKTDDSAILSGLRIYHNHVRSYLGLPDGQTLGDATGIHIDGNNKILTMIQAAVKEKVATRIFLFVPFLTDDSMYLLFDSSAHSTPQLKQVNCMDTGQTRHVCEKLRPSGPILDEFSYHYVYGGATQSQRMRIPRQPLRMYGYLHSAAHTLLK